MLHINYTQTVAQQSPHNTEPLVSELNAHWEVWLQMTGIYIRKAIKCRPLNVPLGIYLTEWWFHLILGPKGLTPYNNNNNNNNNPPQGVPTLTQWWGLRGHMNLRAVLAVACYW